jgi:hypothetical protein
LELEIRADALTAELLGNVLWLRDASATNRNNDVTDEETGAVGRAIAFHHHDEHALRRIADTELLGE